MACTWELRRSELNRFLEKQSRHVLLNRRSNKSTNPATVVVPSVLVSSTKKAFKACLLQ